MDSRQKALRITIVACLTSFGLYEQSFAQNYGKPESTTLREIERVRLTTVVPLSFDYKGLSIPLNNSGQDTSSIQTVLPSAFASEIVITVHDQIRRKQQNADEDIVRRQKALVEGIRRKK